MFRSSRKNTGATVRECSGGHPLTPLAHARGSDANGLMSKSGHEVIHSTKQRSGIDYES